MIFLILDMLMFPRTSVVLVHFIDRGYTLLHPTDNAHISERFHNIFLKKSRDKNLKTDFCVQTSVQESISIDMYR